MNANVTTYVYLRYLLYFPPFFISLPIPSKVLHEEREKLIAKISIGFIKIRTDASDKILQMMFTVYALTHTVANREYNT